MICFIKFLSYKMYHIIDSFKPISLVDTNGYVTSYTRETVEKAHQLSCPGPVTMPRDRCLSNS